MSERDLVLVVDDSNLVRRRMEDILAANGFDVVVREDGQKGVLAALEYAPDLILMDISMPRMDGFRASSMLKGHRQTAMIPLAVFTDQKDTEEKVRFFGIGVEDFITKDAPEAEIVARIRGMLRLKRLRDEILGGTRRLERILDSLDDAVVLVDRDARLVLFNRAAAECFRLIPELVMERRLDEILPASEARDALVGAARDRRELEDQEAVFDLDGRQRVFKVDCSPINLSTAEEPGSALVFKEITAEREAERLKADFYSMIVHELRTPVSVVLGYAQLLLEGKAGELSALQREFLDGIAGKGKNLLQLVNDFLEVSRFERRMVKIERKPMNAAALLRQTVGGIKLLADNRRIALSVACESEELEIAADPGKLEHVFVNIVENAIKYTPDGGSVSVSLARADGGVLLSVTDSGIGMSESEMKCIFTKYQRAKGAETKKIKGTGLGLVIVKEIVDAHGGRIEVESAEGKGSTFRVFIPDGASAATKEANPGAPAVEAAGAKRAETVSV